MVKKAATNKTAPPLKVEGEFTIYTAAALKPAVLAILTERETPALDLSQVTEMDSAGLQLLLLLKREADAQQRTVRLTGISPVASEALELCGLGQLFVGAS